MRSGAEVGARNRARARTRGRRRGRSPRRPASCTADRPAHERQPQAAVVPPQRADREEQVEELAAAVREARGDRGRSGGGPGRARSPVSVTPGAERVDRHPRLAAESRRQREARRRAPPPSAALARQRLATSTPVRKRIERRGDPLRDAEAAALRRAKRAVRESARPARRATRRRDDRRRRAAARRAARPARRPRAPGPCPARGSSSTLGAGSPVRARRSRRASRRRRRSRPRAGNCPRSRRPSPRSRSSSSRAATRIVVGSGSVNRPARASAAGRPRST